MSAGKNAPLRSVYVYRCLWRGYILAPASKPQLRGSCRIASHSSSQNRSEQNSSKRRHTVCDVYIIRSELKGKGKFQHVPLYTSVTSKSRPLFK